MDLLIMIIFRGLISFSVCSLIEFKGTIGPYVLS